MDKTNPTPELNRRRLLLGLAAASTLVAGSAVAVASDTLLVDSENPELIRLGNALPRIEAEYLSAARVTKDIVADWSPKWPAAPDAILWWGTLGDNNIERDITGTGIVRTGEKHCFGLRAVDYLADDIAFAQDAVDHWPGTKTFRGRTHAQWRVELAERQKAHQLAVAYYAERDRVKAASGYDAANAALTEARNALIAAVSAVMATPSQSLVGVMIKAEAMRAWGKVPPAHRILTLLHGDWSAAFGAEILAIASHHARRGGRAVL